MAENTDFQWPAVVDLSSSSASGGGGIAERVEAVVEPEEPVAPDLERQQTDSAAAAAGTQVAAVSRESAAQLIADTPDPTHHPTSINAGSSSQPELPGEEVLVMETLDPRPNPLRTNLYVTVGSSTTTIKDGKDGNKAGYEMDFVDKDLASEYNCHICLSVSRDPQQTKCCGSTYCLYCIQRAMETSKAGCPSCNNQSVELIPDKAQKQKINKLKVHCPVEGCTSIVELADVEAHKNVPHPLSPPFNPPKTTLKPKQSSSDRVVQQHYYNTLPSPNRKQFKSEKPEGVETPVLPTSNPQQAALSQPGYVNISDWQAPTFEPERPDGASEYLNATLPRPRPRVPRNRSSSPPTPLLPESKRYKPSANGGGLNEEHNSNEIYQNWPPQQHEQGVPESSDTSASSTEAEGAASYLNVSIRPRVPRNHTLSPPPVSHQSHQEAGGTVDPTQRCASAPHPELPAPIVWFQPDDVRSPTADEMPGSTGNSASFLNATHQPSHTDEFGQLPFQYETEEAEMQSPIEGEMPEYLNAPLSTQQPSHVECTLESQSPPPGSQTPPYYNLDTPLPSLPAGLLELIGEPSQQTYQNHQPMNNNGDLSDFVLSPSPPLGLLAPLIGLPEPSLHPVQLPAQQSPIPPLSQPLPDQNSPTPPPSRPLQDRHSPTPPLPQPLPHWHSPTPPLPQHLQDPTPQPLPHWHSPTPPLPQPLPHWHSPTPPLSLSSMTPDPPPQPDNRPPSQQSLGYVNIPPFEQTILPPNETNIEAHQPADYEAPRQQTEEENSAEDYVPMSPPPPEAACHPCRVEAAPGPLPWLNANPTVSPPPMIPGNSDVPPLPQLPPTQDQPRPEDVITSQPIQATPHAVRQQADGHTSQPNQAMPPLLQQPQAVRPQANEAPVAHRQVPIPPLAVVELPQAQAPPHGEETYATIASPPPQGEEEGDHIYEYLPSPPPARDIPEESEYVNIPVPLPPPVPPALPPRSQSEPPQQVPTPPVPPRSPRSTSPPPHQPPPEPGQEVPPRPNEAPPLQPLPTQPQPGPQREQDDIDAGPPAMDQIVPELQQGDAFVEDLPPRYDDLSQVPQQMVQPPLEMAAPPVEPLIIQNRNTDNATPRPPQLSPLREENVTIRYQQGNTERHRERTSTKTKIVLWFFFSVLFAVFWFMLVIPLSAVSIIDSLNSNAPFIPSCHHSVPLLIMVLLVHLLVAVFIVYWFTKCCKCARTKKASRVATSLMMVTAVLYTIVVVGFAVSVYVFVDDGKDTQDTPPADDGRSNGGGDSKDCSTRSPSFIFATFYLVALLMFLVTGVMMTCCDYHYKRKHSNFLLYLLDTVRVYTYENEGREEDEETVL